MMASLCLSARTISWRPDRFIPRGTRGSVIAEQNKVIPG
jgi:hypothetical protein